MVMQLLRAPPDILLPVPAVSVPPAAPAAALQVLADAVELRPVAGEVVAAGAVVEGDGARRGELLPSSSSSSVGPRPLLLPVAEAGRGEAAGVGGVTAKAARGPSRGARRRVVRGLDVC